MLLLVAIVLKLAHIVSFIVRIAKDVGALVTGSRSHELKDICATCNLDLAIRGALK